MYSEVYGFRVNLVYLTILVAVYDLLHIFIEFKNRYDLFVQYEDTEFGCSEDLMQPHCVATFSQIGIYAIDFVFTCYLIYGSAKLKTFPVLCWVLLSSYHLLDFMLMFTTAYGHRISVTDVSLILWADIFVSILGFSYVVYFYKKLLEVDRGVIERQRLTKADNLTLTGVDLEAY